jgi:hypothetical protein
MRIVVVLLRQSVIEWRRRRALATRLVRGGLAVYTAGMGRAADLLDGTACIGAALAFGFMVATACKTAEPAAVSCSVLPLSPGPSVVGELKEPYADAVVLAGDAAADYEGRLYEEAGRKFLEAALAFNVPLTDEELAAKFRQARLLAYQDAATSWAMADDLETARRELEAARKQDPDLDEELAEIVADLPRACSERAAE